MVKSTGVRGPTLARLAMFQAGGQPSTWFPPVGLVELYFPSNSTLHKFTKILINFNGWLMITMMIMMMMTTMTDDDDDGDENDDGDDDHHHHDDDDDDDDNDDNDDDDE